MDHELRVDAGYGAELAGVPHADLVGVPVVQIVAFPADLRI